MAINILNSNKTTYILSFLLVIIIITGIAVAYTSIPNPGHGGDRVWIRAPSGEEMSLQQAIDDGVFTPTLIGGDGLSGKTVLDIDFTSGHYGGTACAVIENGLNDKLMCSGRNDYSQLGIGDSINRNKFTEVAGLEGIKSITSGRLSNCVIVGNENKTKCWGYAHYGSLGNGDTNKNKNTPTFVLDQSGNELKDVSSLAIRESQYAYPYKCALMQDGKVKCWGYNGYGQLGVGDRTLRSKATTVSNIDDAIDLKVGGHSSGGFTCALLSDGKVKCWGYNGRGQLGDGTTTYKTTPVYVQDEDGGDLTNVKAIELAQDDYGLACAILDNGAVKCWGYNGRGQLGVGDRKKRTTPTQVLDIDGSDSSKKAEKLEIIGSGSYTSVCALLENKEIKCWGYNYRGRLGVGDENLRTVPTNVIGIDNAKDIEGWGYGHYGYYCAILQDNSVRCWGYNYYGNLGHGQARGAGNYMETSPVEPSLFTTDDVKKIILGGQSYRQYTCALMQDGKVKCWGYNHYGTLGTSDTAHSYVPISPD